MDRPLNTSKLPNINTVPELFLDSDGLELNSNPVCMRPSSIALVWIPPRSTLSINKCCHWETLTNIMISMICYHLTSGTSHFSKVIFSCVLLPALHLWKAIIPKSVLHLATTQDNLKVAHMILSGHSRIHWWHLEFVDARWSHRSSTVTDQQPRETHSFFIPVLQVPNEFFSLSCRSHV